MCSLFPTSPLVTLRSLQKHLEKDSFFDIHIIVSRTEYQVKTIAVAGTNEYAFWLEATEKPGASTKDIRIFG